MIDFCPLTKQLSDYVDQVIAYLALTTGVEAAAVRVLDHLRIVLEAGLEGTCPQEMAFALMKPGHTV
jgi:hypothetical protein